MKIDYRHKVKTLEDLAAAIGPRPRTKTVIMCHGMFDIVHPGHLRHLMYAKEKADLLIASLTAVYLIWSSTYLAMRIVVHDLPPLLSAALRFLSAGTVMMGYALYKGARMPTMRDWVRVLPVGVFLFVGGNGMVVPAGDVDALAARIRMLVGNPELRARMCEAAREDVAAYTPDAWAEGVSSALAAAGAGRLLR
jgi:hypothetical protein